MEAHGHGSIDSFGNVHMAAWVKSTYWTLADMMTIGEEAHHTCETVVEALVSNEEVFAVSEATLKQRWSNAEATVTLCFFFIKFVFLSTVVALDLNLIISEIIMLNAIGHELFWTYN